MSEIKSALLSLTEVFRAPLEAKGVDLSSILDEVEDIVDYSRAYLRLGSNTCTVSPGSLYKFSQT